VADIVPT